MSVDDIEYFAKVKARKRWDYQLAHNAELLSSKDPQDKTEFGRRVNLLASHSDPVIASQLLISFVSEVEVFNKLHDLGKEPHWIPESSKQGVKTPDIYYKQDGIRVPVEVKTLDLEAKEAHDLRSFQFPVHESGPDWDYSEGCKNKLNYFFDDATKKFKHFNDSKIYGELYIIFLPSVHVRLRDGEDGQPLMQERIERYAKEKLDPRIRFEAINSLDKW